jgi:uncharacterized protein (TIGR02996 family)
MHHYVYRRQDQCRELRLDGNAVVVLLGDPQLGQQRPREELRRDDPLAARWELDRQIAQAIADGFTLASAPLSGAAVEAREASFEQALVDDPEQVEGYLVYADWLQARGEPRGELIAVQHAMREHANAASTATEATFAPPAQALACAELVLLGRHRERFFGAELARVVDIDTQRYAIDAFELSWHLGFLRRAMLARSPSRALPQSARVDHLLTEPVPLAGGAGWPELLPNPSARLLREVLCDWVDLEALINAGPPVTLRRVEVSLERWWPAEREAETLAADEFYMNTSLEDVLGPAVGSAPAACEALRALLEQTPPALSELALLRAPFSRELVQELIEAPAATRRGLRVLDLSHGSLRDGELPLLRELLDRLPALEQLDLRRNRLTRAVRDELAQLRPGCVLLDGASRRQQR